MCSLRTRRQGSDKPMIVIDSSPTVYGLFSCRQGRWGVDADTIAGTSKERHCTSTGDDDLEYALSQSRCNVSYG